MAAASENKSQEARLTQIKERLGQGEWSYFFDIDGTIKGSKIPGLTPDGFHPALPDVFRLLQQAPHVKSVGAATSQSRGELMAFLKKMGAKEIGDIFPGQSILEDGNLWLPSGTTPDNAKALLSLEAYRNIVTLKQVLGSRWTLAEDLALSEIGWGFFPGVETPVQFPAEGEQGDVTMSVFERGPHVHEPTYAGQYEPVLLYGQSVLQEYTLEYIEVFEAGNGTMRAVEKGRSKATSLAELADWGQIQLDHTCYAGDGLNDEKAFRLVTEHGGIAIAPSNAHPAILELATYVARAPESVGITQTLAFLLR